MRGILMFTDVFINVSLLYTFPMKPSFVIVLAKNAKQGSHSVLLKRRVSHQPTGIREKDALLINRTILVI